MIDFLRKQFGKNGDKLEAKEIILKEFFNSSRQKKAIKKAARESSEDQRALVAKYHELSKQR
jgi:hypothetical protein